MPTASVFDTLVERVREHLAGSPACHDWDHTLRVLNNARHLCRVEGADPRVVEFAAVLHDIGRPEELEDRGKTCHAEWGAEMTLGLLVDLGITDMAFIRHVSACVRTHRYRRRNDDRPETLEARIVFDADKLDCIGAIGIGRAFHFAGRIGARVHNTAAEAEDSASYSRDDSAYREYLVKLRHVPDRMLTAEGRRMAAARHAFMVAFFEQINREVRGEDLG
ncbi:MAG: HD domain-containing protein [Lentisphaeria bacterium]|nr:HD domain-containing protein [Lentisphaeria bacterium]